MTYDDAISTFKKHLAKLSQYDTDFEVWLATTVEHVHDIFSILSQQYTSITQIKNDYNFARIRDKSVELQNTYVRKTQQLIENFIEQLEEKKKIKIAEIAKKNEVSIKNEDKLKQQLDTLTTSYNSLFSEKHELEQELNRLKNQPKPKTSLFKAAQGVLHINAALFWTVALALLGGFFWFGTYVGTTKFDKNLIDLSDTNRTLKDNVASLKDTIKGREKVIEYMKTISDSALNILGHMPYNEMTLDSLSYRKVQTTIENAGAALYLNKDYHY